MMKNKISLIITRFLSKRFSVDTEEKVQKWIIKDENTEEKEQASLEYWDELNPSADADTYSALQRVNERIGYSRKKAVKIPLCKKVRRIAAVLVPLLILAGSYLYYSSTTSNMIEVTVAYGEQNHLFLPDSSEIWLNAGTTIRYHEKFDDDQRKVYLNGEACFSVTRDEERPFVVETERLSVKVLGTKFNVKAYTEDKKIMTTLTSGKVEVCVENDTRILNPNEQLTYNLITSDLDVNEVPSNETDSWISGQLIFNNAPLNDILQTLERRFNISITNKTQISESNSYTIKFLQNESPEEILNILREVVGFTYQKEDNKIIIEK